MQRYAPQTKLPKQGKTGPEPVRIPIEVAHWHHLRYALARVLMNRTPVQRVIPRALLHGSTELEYRGICPLHILTYRILRTCYGVTEIELTGSHAKDWRKLSREEKQ